MANIFGILAAVVLAATAFFALKNKAALEDQLTELESQQSKLETNNRTFSELNEEAQKNEADAEEAQTAANEYQSELEKVKASNQTLESDLTDKKSARDSKKGNVEELAGKLAAFGNLDDLQRRLEQLQIDLGTLNGDLVAANNQIASRTAKLEGLGTQNENLQSVLANYTKKQSNPSMSTRVTRTVPGLGFVILGGGDNLGIVRDSTLNVVRDGEVVGKLLVTATEPSSAAASIVPDSFEEGVNVRVGDRVVAASSSN